MKVLVSGASGYIGAKIRRDFSSEHDVVGTFNSDRHFDGLVQLDITERRSVHKLVSEVQPDAIVHAAAIASMNQCEDNPQEAIKTNAHGTKNVVEAANEHGVSVVYISSLGAAELNSFYGKTKRAGEQLVQQTQAGYDVLRASMTYGFSPNTWNNRPFNRILRTLEGSRPNRYDASWKFQPTYLTHLSEVIAQILEYGSLNRTSDVLVPAFKSRFEIASDILAPFDVEVEPTNRSQTESETGDVREMDSEFPSWSYEDMIQAITREISERELAKT